MRRCCYEDWPMNRLLDRIAIDPEICGSKPCIGGTRLWVPLILDFLADGMTEAGLIAVAAFEIHLQETDA